jgi:hypothetical protein
MNARPVLEYVLYLYRYFHFSSNAEFTSVFVNPRFRVELLICCHITSFKLFTFFLMKIVLNNTYRTEPNLLINNVFDEIREQIT